MITLPATTQRLLRALPLIAAVGLAAYGVLPGDGVLRAAVAAVVLIVVIGVLGDARAADGSALVAGLAGAGNAILLCAPVALIVPLAFNSGGFYPNAVAIADIAVAGVLVLRLGVAEQPLAGLGVRAGVPIAGLLGLAGWALLSQAWSHAPGRATISFDRDLLYLLTFTLFASMGRTRARLQWVLRGIALALSVVAAFALLSRVAPDFFPTAPVAQSDGRLAYPLAYWNALGIMCAVGLVLCLHLAADDDARLGRLLAAGALPVLGTTLLLTYSRGPLAAAAVGALAYALLGRPRGLISTILAAGPPCAVALASAYGDTLLSGATPTSPAAVHQGHGLAAVVAGAVAATVVLRGLLLLLDRWLEGERSPLERHARPLRIGVGAAALAALLAAVALGAPTAVVHRMREFVDQPDLEQTPLVRARLTSGSADGRVALWTISWDAFDAHPLDGTGSETYQVLYYQHRTTATLVANGHSLYFETLGELGLVGLALVLVYVLGTLGATAPWRRGRDRALYGAIFAAGLAWALHAGVDWDWQVPAVSLPFAILGGLALARPAGRVEAPTGRAATRVIAVGAVVVAAAVAPALVLPSQVRIDQASAAYLAGNCAQAQQAARRAISALGTRALPWQIEGLCALRGGHPQLAQAALRSGLAEDPSSWQLRAALAAAMAEAGGDGHLDAAQAARLDPLDPDVQALSAALARGPSRAARGAARAFVAHATLIPTG